MAEGWRRIADSVLAERSLSREETDFYVAGVRDGWGTKRAMGRVARSIRASGYLACVLGTLCMAAITIDAKARDEYSQRMRSLPNAIKALRYSMSSDDRANAASAIGRHVSNAVGVLKNAAAGGNEAAAVVLQNILAELTDDATTQTVRDARSAGGR